jgi:SecD/SecF fusion protein
MSSYAHLFRVALVGLALAAAAGVVGWGSPFSGGPAAAIAADEKPEAPSTRMTRGLDEEDQGLLTTPSTEPGGPQAKPGDLRRFWVQFAVYAAAIGLPFLIAGFLARHWRMPDYYNKFVLISMTFLLGTAVIALKWPPKLGIDLQGGVILVYEAQPPEAGPAAPQLPAPNVRINSNSLSKENMDKLVAAIGKRVNPSGVLEVTVRSRGSNEVEIIIPEVDPAEVERMKKKISDLGSLEFRILANDRDSSAIMEKAKTLKPEVTKLYSAAGKLQAWWVPVDPKSKKEFNYPEIARRMVTKKGQQELQILVLADPFNVTGSYLTHTATDVDQKGRPDVTFQFNSTGAKKFGGLTSTNLPDEVGPNPFTRKLGIILDNKLFSAPSIQSAIHDRGEITGSFSKQDTEDLVSVLNAGALPATLSDKPISELFTGSTLGSDTINNGKRAMVLSTVVILVFMLFYYHFSGLVANMALALHLLILFAVMLMFKATFTLAGFAGVALTVGMAVDANVLIYERFREEMDRQTTLRMSIRNGFAHAMSAIIDSNVTTLVSAGVLYALGTDQVKGFAVTLFIGVLTNIFASVYCTHVVFDVAERQKWISRLKMMRALSKTSINFWGIRYRCYLASILMITVGMIACWFRGASLLDIDFTGGVSVEIALKQPVHINTVRFNLKDLPDLVVADVHREGEKANLRFVINTATPAGTKDANRYKSQVQKRIQEVFGDNLIGNSMSVGPLVPIPGPQKVSQSGGPSGKVAGTRRVPSAACSALDGIGADGTRSVPATAAHRLRRDLPPDSMLASTDRGSVMLAQATKPSPPSSGAAASAPPASAAPGKSPSPAAPAATKPATPAKPAQPAGSAAKPAAETPAAPNPFAGGVQAELKLEQKLDHATLTGVFDEVIKSGKVVKPPVRYDLTNPSYSEEDTAAYDTWTIRLDLPADQAGRLLDAVKARVAAMPVFPSSNTIGGKVAGETQIHAVYAMIGSMILITLYLWIRFQRVIFGIAAVVALIHDSLTTIGALALCYYLARWFPPLANVLLISPFKIGLIEVAAILTLIGYSVTDTVVVFDRIREVKGKAPFITPAMINTSVNQTLSRTILTSLTVFMVSGVLYALGGATIHGFSFAMLFGVVTGTYSSVYIAAPLLLVGAPHVKAAEAANANRK